jgi:glutamate/tyrosine decarboxylase-like PLP-dependent enzyme
VKADDEIPIQLSADSMREFGYRVVDLIVQHIENLPTAQVSAARSRSDLESALLAPPSEDGRSLESLFATLSRDVLGPISHVDHPRFFAYVPSPGNFVGAMGDALASGFNVFAGAWGVASGPAQIELVVIEWLRTFCGLPATAGGLFVSGGSLANLTALVVARETIRRERGDVVDNGVVYATDQAHSSIDRGAMVAGISASRIRRIATDDDGRMNAAALAKALEEDVRAGVVPIVVIANAGTTSTGVIDPIEEIADVCTEYNAWLHVDGAYGAAAVIGERERSMRDGLARADSITLDPHKWLFQPFECGCLLVRNAHVLRDTFRLVPAYLRDNDAVADEVNFRDSGIQLTRSFRALKLWMSIETFGLAAFRNAIDASIARAELAEKTVRKLDGWEMVTPARLAILTFRFAPAHRPESSLDELNRQVAERLAADGFALLSTTTVDGKTVLRLCTINPRTTDDDLLETIERLRRIGDALVAPL